MSKIDRFFSNIKKVLPMAILPVALSSCAPAPVPYQTATSPYAPQKMGSTMVCRDQQCSPTALNMTREYVINSIHKLLESNVGQDVFFCEADPNTRTCLNDFIEYPMLVGITPGTMRLDRARLLDAKATKMPNKVEFVLDYNFYFNGIKAYCAPSVNVAYAKSADNIVMENNETACQLTTNYVSRSNHIYTVDFIDLDYGMVGAYYSLGMSGVAYGGKGGYMIMRFPNGVKFPGQSASYRTPSPKAVMMLPTVKSTYTAPMLTTAPTTYAVPSYAPRVAPMASVAPVAPVYKSSTYHKDANSIKQTKHKYSNPYDYHPYYFNNGSEIHNVYGHHKPLYHYSYDHIPLATSK